MALSYITREADGVQAQFDFPFGYLSKSHVFVFVDNSLVAFKWISDFLVEPIVPLLPGQQITIRRLTDRANRVTTYTDGQTLLASSLNAGDLQTFFIAQEMIDQIEEGIVSGDVSVLNAGAGYITAQWIQDQLTANLAAASQFSEIDAALLGEATARAAGLAAEAAARAAAIGAEAIARGAAITAEAAARTTEVLALTTDLEAEAATRTADVLALTAADADQVGRLVIVESDLNTPTTGVKAKLVTVEDAITTETTARATADTAILAEIDAPGTGLKARATSLESRTTAVEIGKAEASELTSLAARVTTAEGDISTNEAAITTEATARATEDTAIAASVTTLAARVTTAEGDITAAEAAIVTANDAIATETTARATADTAILAEINDPTTGLKARATSLESRTTNVENDKAEATALTALAARVTTAEGDITAAEASVVTETNARVTADNALSTSITALTARVGTAEADIVSVEDAIATETGARTTQVNALDTRVGTAEAGLVTVNEAVVDLAYNKAEASTVTALSASMDSLTNEVDAIAWDDVAYFCDWSSGTANGWAPANSTLSYPGDGSVLVTQSGGNGDVYLQGPTISVDGSRYTKVIVDLECVAAGTPPVVADYSLFYTTAGHSYTGSYKDVPRESCPIVAGSRLLQIYDMDAPLAGGTDWITNTITRIRVDVPQAIGSQWKIHSVRIVAPTTTGALRRISQAEANIVTAQNAVVDLENTKASASSVTALTATVDTVKMNDANIRPSNRIGFITPVNGTPVTQPQITAGTVVAAPNEGQVLQVSGGLNLSHRNYLPILPGRTYRVRARVRATADGTDQRINIGWRWYDASYNYVNVNSGFIDTTFVTADGWRTLENTISGSAILASSPTAAYLTTRLFIGYNASSTSAGGTWQIAWADIADITELQNTAEIAAAGSALNRNPFFAEGSAQTGVVPQGWVSWSNGANCNIETRPWGGAGLHAFVPALAGTPNIGWLQDLGQGAVRAGNKYLVRADVARGTGTYAASGVFLQWYNSSNGPLSSAYLSFFAEPDTSGVIATTGDGRRVFEKTFTAPALATKVVMYAMTAWGGLGQSLQATSPQLRWFECSLHQINSSTAGVTELREALATGSSSTARLLLGVNTATNVATIEAAAFEGDGVWNGSAVTLQADLIKLLAQDIAFGSRTQFEDTRGTIYNVEASKRLRILGPFGASNDLVLWYGLNSVALQSETKTNGIFAIATDGLVYLGASSLSAPMSVSHSGNYVATRIGTGTLNTGSITLTPVGGSGSYTYSHQLIVTSNPNSVAVQLNSPTSATFSISAPSTAPVKAVEYLVVSTVTDSAGRVVQYARGGSLVWES